MNVIGIQGGPGSFNDLAITRYLEHTKNFHNTEIKYLYTTSNVLSAVTNGEVFWGQYAIKNSIGGDVLETKEAFSDISFEQHYELIAQYDLKIAHSLMIHPDASVSDIKTILTHEQVLKQCKNNLGERYPHCECMEGSGELRDPARVAEAIMGGIIPKTTATLSCELIATKIGLKIVDSNLQDREDNITSFVLIKKK